MIVAFRFVKPVTTASGKLAGIAGVGDGDAVAEAVGAEEAGGEDEAGPPGVGWGVGLAMPHPARSATTATARAARFVGRVFMPLW